MTLPAPRLEVAPISPGERDAVIALWRDCGLVVPWNDPADDIEFCLRSGHGTVLAGRLGGAIVAAIMVGHDGHRGWIYYAAVAPALRSQGLGRAIVAAAEAWMAERGVPKAELMVRSANRAVTAFYRRLGYGPSDALVLQRWLKPPKVAQTPVRRIEIRITYLEMTAPPARRVPVTPPGQIALLRLAEPSVPFYRHLYNTVGEPWLWYERREMSDAALAAAIRRKGVEISVLYAGGEPVGYAELDFADPRDVNLAYFGLVPPAIGRGYGAYLLGAVTDEVWRRGARRFWVHTCTLDHPKALAVYQRGGFVAYKQETQIIADPRDRGTIPPEVTPPPGNRILGPTDS